MKLSDKDKHLCGALAEARWLTTEPLTHLCFPQRHERDVRRRLHQLSGGEGAAALLVRHRWPTLDGLRTVWGLTPGGYAEAEALLDRALMPPSLAFDPATAAHHEALTELYVALLAAPLDAALAQVPKTLSPGQRRKALTGLYARAGHRGWTWTTVGDGVHLPWRDLDPKAFKPRVIRPDAVLELHQARRRLFVECEMGTHTIVPRFGDNKPNATLSKLARYENYLYGRVEYPSGQTWYQRKYGDGYEPEVLFLEHSERRARNVRAAIDAVRWRDGSRPRVTSHVWTLQTAVGELLPVSGALAPEGLPRAKDGIAPNALTAVEAAALVRFIWSANRDLELRQREARHHRGEAPDAPEGLEMAKVILARLQTAPPAAFVQPAPAAPTKPARTIVSGEVRLLVDFFMAAQESLHVARVDARARNLPAPDYPGKRTEVAALLQKLARSG